MFLINYFCKAVDALPKQTMADVFTRMQERQQARLSALEERKTQKQGGKRVEETPEYFAQQLEGKKEGK
jgi:type IV secretory pathway VirB6-like protein